MEIGGISLPANLPPEALAKQRKYQEAKTISEKIRALEEYIAAIPKHKGTEKLLMQLKRKLAKLKKEAETSSKRSGWSGVSFHVKKEGAGQVVLVGLTSTGKSELLKVLTGCNVEVGDYPFTTKRPEPGVTYYEDVPIQVVEVPALFEGASCGSRLGSQILSVIRNADVVALIVDLAMDIDYQMKMLMKELVNGKIYLNATPPPIEIEKTSGGGINVVGSNCLKDCKVDDIVNILRNHGIYNAIVKVFGPVTLQDFINTLEESITYKPALIIATKGDLPGTSGNYKKLMGKFGDMFRVVPVSSKKGKGLDLLKKTFFEMLNVVRVYTRDPAKGVSEKPIILKKPATVADVAKRIHKKFIKEFKFARIWRKSEKIEVMKVGLDFEVQDSDIIQIYTS